MVIELYAFLTILNAGLLLVCGLMFLFTAIPDKPLLGSYRKARYLIAVAYLILSFEIIVKYFFIGFDYDRMMTATTILGVAVSQALIFTLVMLALLEVKLPKRRCIIIEVTIAMMLIIAIIIAYRLCSEDLFMVVFYLLSGMYALLITHYTTLFFRSYNRFKIRMDNYFSDLEAERMQWVIFLFFAALSIGVIALLSAVFMSMLISFLFMIACSLFYVWFAIRFINYGLHFHLIEHALENELNNGVTSLQTDNTVANKNDSCEIDSIIFDRIEKQVEKWVAEKKFIQKGITIDMLASEFITNRHYLSSFFNIYKKKTFREWINKMRIEEAKDLISKCSDIPLSEIAEQTGFADNSHFTRQFIKFMGETPSKWKQKI